jgi:hypothetical protein
MGGFTVHILCMLFNLMYEESSSGLEMLLRHQIMQGNYMESRL